MKTQNTLLEQLLQKITELNTQLSAPEAPNKKDVTESGFLKFTEKEISKMPKSFRYEFRVDGCTAHVRKRCDGRYNCSYEIRYRRNGYNVTASATVLDVAKQRFIEKLKTAGKPVADTKVPTNYSDFVVYFFENYYVERVVPQTFKNAYRLFERWIKPYFENIDLKKITPGMCKGLLQSIKNKGLQKTADDVHSLLNQTLKMAVAYNLIPRNPLAVISFKQHERKNGKRLSLEEETLLLTQCKPKYRYIFAVYLYCGLRPGEIYSVQIGEQFITSRNLKQKDFKIEYKKIPIIDKLRPYLNEIPAKIPTLPYIREEFNRIVHNHELKDCRRTFSSHCKELGVNDDVREKILGHAVKKKLDKAYVEFTDEFILQEAKKLVW